MAHPTLIIQVVRALSPEEAKKVLTWANQLADLARAREIEWSDTRTDEDVVEAAAASVRRFEEQESKNR